MQRKFLICKTCGNLIEMIIDSGVTPKCCNNEMVEIIANTTEAATEKHIPVIEINEDIATIIINTIIAIRIIFNFISYTTFLLLSSSTSPP